MAKKQKIEEDLLKIGLFIIFDGLVFHEVISSTHGDIQSLRLAPSSRIIDFLKVEWKKIMKINYQPIFGLANSVCLSFPTSPDTDRILKKLIETALDIVSSGVLLRHDLMGRIYHTLLLKITGKHYATYYTSVPAAWLLSNLTIKTPNPDLNWKFENTEDIKDFRVFDPACGSGTLLSGIYMALKDKYTIDRYNADDPKPLNLIAFHKIMLEDVLSGWDILDYAGHLTLTTLALHNPKSIFTHSNISTLRTGLTGRKIHLGSLDILDDLKGRLMGLGFGTPLKEKGIEIEREEEIDLEKYVDIDVIIMNPPFSRSAQPNIKFGYEKKIIMNRMNKYLGKLGKNLGYSGIGQAGLGAYFIVLGDKSLKWGGRLALVIQRSILSGISWEKIRGELLKNYEIEYVVSNYDPGDRNSTIEPWNWSENTNLGEVLIVARKTKKLIEERYTTFINLWNKSRNEPESLKIASDSMKARRRQRLKFLEGEGYETLNLNKEVGVVYNVSHKYLEKNFLIPCLFAHPDLNKWAFQLTYNNLLPLVPLGKITEKMGVDIKQIEDNFKLVSHQTRYSILWGHPGSLNTIELKDFQYASPKRQTADIIYDKKKGNLLIAERMWASTSSIVAIFSINSILSTEFWEILLENNIARILNVWFNSTFGFLFFLVSSTSHRGDRFTLKKEQLLHLPILDISILSNRNKRNLLKLFERIKNIPFNPFPQEFELASKDKGIRKEIDDEFIKVLNLNINLKPYYEMLSKEPVISLKRL